MSGAAPVLVESGLWPLLLALLGGGTAAAASATAVIGTGLAGFVGGELIGWVVGEVMRAPALPDARPFPFAATADGCGVVLPGRAVGAPGGVHVEYAEAFQRLGDLVSLAAGCTDKLSELEVRELRAQVARALNAGIVSRTVDGVQAFACDDIELRPTRGQVRAWLGTLANTLGRICADAELGAAVDAARAPLTAPASVRRGLSPLGWALVVAGVVGAGFVAWRLWGAA